MPATTEITLEMLHEELTRIRGYMEAYYPQMVKDHKITPWERNHRLSCNKALLSLLRQLMLQEKTHGPLLSKIINELQ